MANSVPRTTLFQSQLLIPGKYAPILPSVSSSGLPNERPKWQNYFLILLYFPPAVNDPLSRT
jgi:hypothetical protein